MTLSESSLQIGKFIPNEGIYMGFGVLPNTNRPLHYFAAPENLTPDKKVLNFRMAALELAERKNWHGHNGADFGHNWRGYEQEVYKSLQEGRLGHWFLPVLPLVSGHDVKKHKIWDGNFFDLQNTGDFSGTFQNTTHYENPEWFGSCSAVSKDQLKIVAVRLSSNRVRNLHKNFRHMNARPVRAVESLAHLKL